MDEFYVGVDGQNESLVSVKTVMSGAPSESSARVVKLTLPCSTSSIYFLHSSHNLLHFSFPFALIPLSTAFIFIGLARTLALILLCGLGAFSSEVARTFIDEETVCVARTIGLYIL